MPHGAAHHSGLLPHDPRRVVLDLSPGMSELDFSFRSTPYQRVVDEGAGVVRVDERYRKRDRPTNGSKHLDLRALFPGRKLKRPRSNRCRLRWPPGGG